MNTRVLEVSQFFLLFLKVMWLESRGQARHFLVAAQFKQGLHFFELATQVFYMYDG